MKGNDDGQRRSCVALAFAILALTCGLMASDSGQTNSQKPTPDYLNTSLPLGKRVDDLISRMTLEEKVRQMQNEAPAIPRLGIPPYGWQTEALHGLARRFASVGLSPPRSCAK